MAVLKKFFACHSEERQRRRISFFWFPYPYIEIPHFLAKVRNDTGAFGMTRGARQKEERQKEERQK